MVLPEVLRSGLLHPEKSSTSVGIEIILSQDDRKMNKLGQKIALTITRSSTVR